MGFLRQALFAVWSLLNVVVAGVISFSAFLVMSLRYDEMHTISTALDPDPSLTRGTVVVNVIEQTALSLAALAVVALVFWGLNYMIYADGSSYRRTGLWISCVCTLALLPGIAAADFDCLNKYPSPL